MPRQRNPRPVVTNLVVLCLSVIGGALFLAGWGKSAGGDSLHVK
jgi:hypothetical protein